MLGFFSSKETSSVNIAFGKSLSCTACGLYKGATTPRMVPFGNFKKKIMNIGNFPTRIEDKKGKSFQDKRGQFLKKIYDKLGIDLYEDCINLNAVNCTTDEDITPHQISCCRKAIVQKAIDEYKPHIIVAFGKEALLSLIGNRWQKDFDTIDKWRGYIIPDQDLKAFVCPVYSLAFAMNEDKDDCRQLIFKKDLEGAFTKLKEPFPEYKEPKIDIIEDLSIFNNKDFGRSEKYVYNHISWDIETTGLKPQNPEQKIVCASVADSFDHAYSFMIPKSRKKLQPFLDLLQNKKVAKMGWNIKFEDTWAAVKWGIKVETWTYDGMLGSHVFDNRPLTTGLKFQNYVVFGVIDYASEVAPYLEAVDSKNSNSLNRIMELIAKPGGKEKVLTYCGYDSVNEYRIDMLQKDILEKQRNNPYNLK